MGLEAPSAATGETPMQRAHRNRLLRDITEMQQKPYPRIRLTPIDLTRACLVLTPENYPPLHLTILFGDNYPLQAPRITIQSEIRHPNVFGNYICASILNTTEGYTPAYTLKGICIQMLSFFNSDAVEQVYSGYRISLESYRQGCGRDGCPNCSGQKVAETYKCVHCSPSESQRGQSSGTDKNNDGGGSSSSTNGNAEGNNSLAAISRKASENGAQKRAVLEASIGSLPDEILLETLENVDFEDLMAFAQAWPRVRQIIKDYDLVRSRELQCFTVKESYKHANLGIGIAFTYAGLIPRIDSEFDLISYEAYEKLKVRRSVQGIPYNMWLPLPISYRHWFRVQGAADIALGQLARYITKPRGVRPSAASSIFTFMNDIVVRLNLDLERQQAPPRRQRREYEWNSDDEEGEGMESKSTLRHASEKAIESYFHLFHLLVCLATGPHGKEIVAEANMMIRSFQRGRRDKRHVPNLGHLLTAMHISDVEVTDELRKAIITEAITRNVVWLLDGRGAGMAELGDTVRASVERGYSRDVPAYTLLSLRMHRDGEMDRDAAMRRIWSGGAKWQYSKALAEKAAANVKNGSLSFFPNRGR
ncbi:hypothetical protein PWT90_10715 [Aphanocladium album]|nr:hypothetical protein PWT90_10715 [Aphanocladium album]